MTQASNIFLLHCKLRTLVCHWTGPDGLFHGMVLICVPKYSTDNGDLCNWKGFLVQGNIHHRLRYGISAYLDVYLRLLYDGACHRASPNTLASEGRR